MRAALARRIALLGLLGSLVAATAAASARRDLLPEAFEQGLYSRPVAMAAYAPSARAEVAEQVLDGRLRITGSSIEIHTLVADPAYLRPADLTRARSLPNDVEIDLIQQGEALIPRQRGPQPSAHGWWEWTTEPGRVWREPGEDYARAALPFALVQRNANCTHNGVLMLLLRDGKVLPRGAVQISSETCQYLKFDLWGFVDVRFASVTADDKAQRAAQYQAELAARLPTRPLAALAGEQIDPSAFSIGDPQADSRHGLLYQGLHYSSECPTRHGPYPYCEVLDLPSFSLAKSVLAAVALMRIEQRYPGSADSTLSQWIDHPACQSEAWQRVRLRDLLDMASGHYDSSHSLSDPEADMVSAFFRAERHADKLAFACGAYSAQEAPGQRWVYRTSDTYLLGSALNSLLRHQTGDPGQDIFRDVVVAEVYAPLALSPTAQRSRRSYDEVAQPLFGWGLTLLADDLLKLARFLGPQQGRIGTQQVLDPALLAQAMQRDAGRPGLQAAHLARFRYQLGLWARDLQPVLGCAAPTWVPFMSGFGGLTVALFPNDLIWYKFADDGELASIDFAEPAKAAAKLADYCQRKPD